MVDGTEETWTRVALRIAWLVQQIRQKVAKHEVKQYQDLKALSPPGFLWLVLDLSNGSALLCLEQWDRIYIIFFHIIIIIKMENGLNSASMHSNNTQ